MLKEDIRAFAFTLAVAPVKMRVGGNSAGGEDLRVESRRGRTAREKRKAPRAETSRPAKNSSSVSSRKGLRTKRPDALKMAAFALYQYTLYHRSTQMQLNVENVQQLEHRHQILS